MNPQAGSSASASSASSNIEESQNKSRHPAHARTKIYNHWDDEWKDDPNQVEELLSNELYKLSMEDRNKFQDEIHGVRCIAPEETPELLRCSLRQMEYELEHEVPLDQKRAYLRSKELQLQLQETTYIHQDDFKLRFLRCELFDVPKAAIRMALFLDLLVDLFGDYALERPIRISDFTKKELAEFRKGRFQLLNDRDRGVGSGRRICCVFPDKGWAEIPPRTRHKIALYQTFVAGYDVDVQRKGIVFVAWFDSNLEPSWKPALSTKIHQIPSVRMSSVHICTPDTPFYRLRRALAVMSSGNSRMRLRIHIGEPIELRYFLQGFGLPSEKVPITYSGTIKTANLRKWMRFRHLQEDEYCHKSLARAIRSDNGSSNRNSNPGNSSSQNIETVEITDCPYLTDVLFRKGKNMTTHPGNALMRRLMQSKIESGVLDTLENYKTRQFIFDVIEELKNYGRGRDGAFNNPPIRLLEWDDNGSFWKEIHDGDTIYNKIRHIVKEIQGTAKDGNATKRKTQMITQSGGTSIFQLQDGSPSTPFGCISNSGDGCMKKQKLNGGFG